MFEGGGGGSLACGRVVLPGVLPPCLPACLLLSRQCRLAPPCAAADSIGFLDCAVNPNLSRVRVLKLYFIEFEAPATTTMLRCCRKKVDELLVVLALTVRLLEMMAGEAARMRMRRSGGGGGGALLSQLVYLRFFYPLAAS